MTRWCLAFIACFMLVPLALAGDLDREIDEARRQLDEAARELAELHRKQYALGRGQKKAMLGILLGDHMSKDAVELVGVTPGGGAEQAGLKAGDRIVKMDDLSLGQTKSPMHALSKYMKKVTPGEKITVVYVRGDERRSATITTQAQSTQMLRMLGEKLDIDLGFEDLVGITSIDSDMCQDMSPKGHDVKELLAVSGDLAEYFDVERGIVLLTPKADSKLKAGDVLLSIDGGEVKSLDDALQRLTALDESAKVIVQRHGRPKTVEVYADEFADLAVHSQTRIVRIKTSGNGDDDVTVKVDVRD